MGNSCKVVVINYPFKQLSNETKVLKKEISYFQRDYLLEMNKISNIFKFLNFLSCFDRDFQPQAACFYGFIDFRLEKFSIRQKYYRFTLGGLFHCILFLLQMKIFDKSKDGRLDLNDLARYFFF